MSKLQIGLANVIEVDGLWPQLAQKFDYACTRCNSEWTAGTLWQLCRSGGAYLLIVHDGDKIHMASVWRFEDRSFRCVMMFGSNMREWWAMARDFVTKIARENGARKLVAEGRNGWARFFGSKNGLDYEVNI